MAHTDIVNTKWLQRIVMSYALIMLLALTVIQSHVGKATIFDFRFNGFALISLASVLANLYFVLVVLKRRTEFRSAEVTWYFMFLCTVILFGTFEMLQRLSTTPHGALFWAQLGGIGPAFESVGLFLFALLYTNRRAQSLSLIPLVVLGGSLLFFFHANGGLVFQTTDAAIKHYAWGYNNDIGPAFGLNALWAFGLISLAIGMLLVFAKRTPNEILKHQARLFAVAISFPLIAAILFDGIAPSIGLKVPPLHTLFTIITAGLMLYGLRHYKVFDVTPASIAEDILSTMSESVIVVNEKLEVELMNDLAEKVFGKSYDDMAGSPLTNLFNQQQKINIEQALRQVILPGERYPVGKFELVRAGKPMYISATASRVTEEHGAAGYTLAFADVTELQNSYDALEQEKHSVERKVEERTKELREAQERLAETDKMKTEFVVLTSHHLRTPLTIIKGNLEFLSDSKLDEKQKYYLASLTSSTKRLGDLVEELLTISSIEAGDRANLESVDLRQVLKPVIEEAGNIAKTTKNKFTVEDKTTHVTLNANPTRLQAAVRNLLDNAFKFTKIGNVSLSIAANAHDVTIEVSDTGIGITADEMPKLFTKFHKGNSRDALNYDYAGEGVGLYLAKLIIEEHKGHIKVSSEPNKGTVVTVTLPLA